MAHYQSGRPGRGLRSTLALVAHVPPAAPRAFLWCLLLFFLFQTAACSDDKIRPGAPRPNPCYDFDAALSEAGKFPFDATGLTAHPKESAEEILMRAHTLDPDAVVLAAAGYAAGIGGFPRFPEFLWEHYARRLSDRQTEKFLSAMASHQFWDGKQYEDPFRYAIDYEVGLGSRYAPLFKQAGIFDMEEWCAGVAKVMGKDPDLRAELRERKAKDFFGDTRPGRLEVDDKDMELARALRPRAATPEELQRMTWILQSGRAVAVNCFLFFAATTHAPGRERPDWSPARLMEFAAMRDKDPEPGSAAWRDAALRIVTYRGMLDAPSAHDLIRRAHRGETRAMRAMAGNYETGAMEFLKDEDLRQGWLSPLQLSGDVPSLLFVSITSYTKKYSTDWATAWTYAYLAHERGNNKEKELAAR